MSSEMGIIIKSSDLGGHDHHRRESVDSGVGSVSPSPLSCENQPSIARQRKKKKKRLFSTLSASTFHDLYTLKNDILGQGSYGRVETCVNDYTKMEYAVKIVNKDSWAFNRQKMLKEIELYYLCQGNDSIIQLIDYFEEPDKFYLVFEKARGGHLLNQINQKQKFSEKATAKIMSKLASALKFLHSKGIAHRDLKPENILCMTADDSNDDEEVAAAIRLCDFDLCSKVQPSVSTPRLSSPVGSPEYLAPEVVEVFLNEDNILYDLLDEDLTYDKSCDLWSLGVICYTLLCGLLPFRGFCGQDCGWEDRNEECVDCQQDLFEAIKRGKFEFPDHVSYLAKDLIIKLLQIDPDLRMDASDVLEHPWITKLLDDDNEEELETEIAFRPVSPNALRRAWSFSQFSWMNQKNVDPGAKFRRQSSVVTSFCQPPEDLLCRCEL